MLVPMWGETVELGEKKKRSWDSLKGFGLKRKEKVAVTSYWCWSFSCFGSLLFVGDGVG